MYGFCLGELGMRYEQARRLLIWEFNLKMQYKETQRIQDRHRLRALAAIALNPHSKKPIPPDRLIPISAERGPVMSKQRIADDVRRKLRAYRKAKQ